MFLVHPTRLSKIFAEGRTHPCGNARHRQASKLAGRTHAKSRMRSPKMKLLKKNLPGRPYSAPAVARPEFCYHSLHEDHSLYTTLPGAQASPHVERTQTLEIGDSLRISEPLHTSKPGLQLFLCPPAQFCGIAGLCFHYQQLTVVGFARHHRQKSVDGGRGDAAAPRRGDPHAGLRASPLHFGGTPSPARTGRSALRLVWRNGRFRGINGQKVRPPVLIPPIVPAVSRGRL